VFILWCILVLTGACSEFLEPYPSGDRSEEDLWKYQDMVQGLVGQCYDYIPRNYNDNEGAYLDGATDNAVLTSSTHSLRRLAMGEMTTGIDAFQTYWTRDYRAIRLVNIFLKDRRGYNTKFIINDHWNDLVKNRLQGEAFALRAWFEWDLLQKFGGKAANGEMLGFPIVTEPLDDKTSVDLARNTYNECIKQILDDCDSAFKYLPLAHRDFLVPVTADRVYAGGKYFGRFDGISIRALKANVYLTWASPRFNPGNDLSRWDSAAYNAKKVIDFKINVDQITSNTNSFRIVNGVTWTNPNFGGIVLRSRFGDNDDMERMFYPGGFQGNGEIGASQNLVDAFGMKNGRPISDPLSLYDPLNPYANRDPRFYAMIFYNSSQAKRNNTSPVMYTFENWSNGGKDAAGAKSTNSLTNYHIKKFVHMGLNWSDASINRQPHSKFLIRWAHMVLTFAEAANHVTTNPNTQLYGLSPKAALAYLRTRKTYDDTNGLSATDPYLDEVAAAGKTAFDALVRNERRIETCFEGMRFYDLRRWTTDADWESTLNAPIRAVTVTQNTDLSFTYDFNYEVEEPVFQSPYLPIPYNEMLRMSKLIQNEGWSSWN
jgi:hypothetical protein